MSKNIPDGGDVAVFDVDGAEQKSNAKGECVKLEKEDWNEKPSPGGRDAVDESKDEDNDEIDKDIDDGCEGG